MGNRRLGTKRLNALLKAGSNETDSSYQAGAGIKNAVHSHRIVKDGLLIKTQILVDLQGNGNGTIWAGATDAMVIGEATAKATNAVSDAQLLTWENDIHGAFRSVSMHCIEAITGGANVVPDVRLTTVNAAKKSGEASGVADDAAGDLINPKGVWAVGKAISNGVDGNNDHDGLLDLAAKVPDGHKIYLTQGASEGSAATNYTAGKFLIEFIGTDTSLGF